MKRIFDYIIKIILVTTLVLPTLQSGIAITKAFGRVEIPGLTDIAEGMNGVAVADFNKDGNLDIVATFSPPGLDTKSTDKIRFYLGDGNFGFKTHEFTVDGKIFFDCGKTNPQVPVLADFNRDGWLDLFITHHRGRINSKNKVGNRLLITQGSYDRFIDVSVKMGIQNIDGYNRQATFGDVNLDGWLDIAVGCDMIGNPDVAGLPNQKLYVFKPNGNNFADGKFEDIGGTQLVPEFGGDFNCKDPNQKSGAPDINLVDLDNDSDLDLVQSYHNDMLNTESSNLCGSIRFKFGIWTWKNLAKETGKLQFVKMTDNGLAQEGFVKLSDDGKQVLDIKDAARLPYLSFADVDNDGLQDVLAIGPSFLAKQKELGLDTVRGKFWKNLGGFKFEERTKQAGFDSLSWTYLDWFKFQGFDTKPIEGKEGRIYGADAVFLDYNNDGFQDVVCCDRSEAALGKSRNVLYINKGDGTFEPKPESFSGLDYNSICAETGDFNNDGLPDLIFAVDPDNSSLPTKDRNRYMSKVYKNLGDASNGWLKLRFSGVSDAVKSGTRIEVYDASTYGNDKKILIAAKIVMSNHSYKSGCPLETLFGLGKTKSVVVKAVLPGGKTVEFINIKPNQYLDVNLETMEVFKIEQTTKPKPNIIFFLTDDLDSKLDTMKYTPKIKKYLADAGATFTQFFISNTLCCPSRTTILRGQFSHNNKVLTNGGPEGGFERFLSVGNEDSTVATWLQDSGYKTVLMGKFLNGYPLPKDPTHVPKGWTEWYSPAKGNAYGCYDYTMNENGKLIAYGKDPDDYMNDVLSSKATDFIERMTKGGDPFFAYIAPYSPHGPATPAKRHEKLFPDIKAPRTPNFNEADISDKPTKYKGRKKLTEKEIAGLDREYGLRVRSMQSVDDLVENVVKALEKSGQLDNTYLVFIGDNGFHLGQHRLPGGKGTAYEEDILVPCYIRGPGIKAGSTVSDYLTGNVDLASTFADMADVSVPDFVDGRSLLPLAIGGKPKTWRNAFFIEFYPFQRPKSAYALMKEGIYEGFDADEADGKELSTATYIAIRTKTHTYIEHQTGEKEFYDIIKDPWQLENQATKADKSLLAKYSAWANQLLKSGGSRLWDIEEKTIDSLTDSNPKPYLKFADIVYKTTDSDKNLTSLDVYTPDKSGKNPVLVWIHGGSWSEGDKISMVTDPYDMPKVFCTKGYVVVSINYRLSPAVKFPIHPQDVASAIAWVKTNISSYGGDPSRINISGHSAGAHLTALVSTDERYLKAVGLELADIKSAVPSDAGTYDFIAFANRQKEKKAPMPKNFIEVFTEDEKVWKEASPIYYVQKGKKIPPMLVFYSKGNDKNANNEYYGIDTKTFVKRLTDEGFDATAFGALDMDHGALVKSFCDPDAKTTKAFLEFLDKQNSITTKKDQPYQRSAIDIPMRDSKKLAADLYSTDTKAKKPTILVQTPYDKSKYWTQFKARIPFSVSDYNVVILDWRGRFASKQAQSSKANTGQDGYDAVEWIAKQSWSNGKIGTYGGSALGDVQFKTASYNPPHLVCAVPMVKDFKVTYEEFFFGGEFRKEQSESLQKLEFFKVSDIISQPIYNQFWKTIESKSDLSSKINVPMLMIGGWFDHYPDLVLRAFSDIQTKSDPKVKNLHKLIYGPWQHGNLNEKKQGILEFANAEGFGDREAVRFMEHYLLGYSNKWEETPTVQYYQMGDETWKNTPSWVNIPRNEVSYYINSNNSLTSDKPVIDESSLSFVYDPKDPTPSIGGKRFDPSNPKLVTGPQDQKTIENRKDVLVFSSSTLSSDLTINGLMKAKLYFSSNQKDTDISIRFCDVYPDGKSVLMVEGIQRTRFRNSLEKEELMVPGTVYQIDVKLQNMALTIKKGHKIRIIVSSASYPIFESNPNNGGKLYADKTMLTATNNVYFGKKRLSQLILPVLNK